MTIAVKRSELEASKLISALVDVWNTSIKFSVKTLTGACIEGTAFEVVADLPKRFGETKRLVLCAFVKGWNAHESA